MRSVLLSTIALLALLGLALGMSACGSSSSEVGSTESTASGDLAPDFSGVTLAGDIVSLDQYRGKPLLLVYMTYT